MSVVCATSTGAVVITKGADSVMKNLMAGQTLPASAQTSLDTFSRQGLRTLVVARREMTMDAYQGWKSQWEKANSQVSGKDAAVESVAASAEVDMTYIGVTALEDRLQDKVPATIQNLREAGIRVWVLTGDKVETAIEIAKSCKLFEPDMQLVQIVNDAQASDSVIKARDALAQDASKIVLGPKSQVAHGMVLDGISVAHILADGRPETRRALYEMAEKCSSCVCCRLSPLQKRELVELVRAENSNAITLSIGDGANDVPMIQGAHVGIGIRGKEGSAAVQACDVAVSQFHFLGNLLLCHGRKAYRRMATFLCFFIYRSVCLGWSYALYAATTSFSGQLAFPEWLDIMYSPLTTCSVVFLVAFDCDYKDEEAVQRPELYSPGPKRTLLNLGTFGKWMFFATWHGILAWAVPTYSLIDQQARVNQTHEFWQASFVAFTSVIIIVHLKLFIVAVKPMSIFGVCIVVFEMLVYIPVVLFLASSFGAKVAPEFQNVPMEAVASLPHLLQIIFVPIVAVSLDIFASCNLA